VTLLADIDTATRVWHHGVRPLPDPAIPVVMPVGPDHNPMPSLDASLRASRGAPALIHVVVLNGETADTGRVRTIRSGMRALAAPFALVEVRADIGYVRAVEIGLATATRLGARNDRVGFLDADSDLRDPRHWAHVNAELDSDASLDAVSGLVIHAECEVWETLSSARFVHALSQALGRPVEKPYIQGGAGGTLARRHVFEASVSAALAMGTLIGPTLSAAAIARGRSVRATGRLPCGHTRRRTMAEWLASVTTYERSWRKLVHLHGSDIETPWLSFLDRARHLLRHDPAILADIAENQRLRRNVVEAVERSAGRYDPALDANDAPLVAATRAKGRP